MLLFPEINQINFDNFCLTIEKFEIEGLSIF
jgi:hypothetical protein